MDLSRIAAAAFTATALAIILTGAAFAQGAAAESAGGSLLEICGRYADETAIVSPALTGNDRDGVKETCLSEAKATGASPDFLEAGARGILDACKSFEGTGRKWLDCFTNALAPLAPEAASKAKASRPILEKACERLVHELSIDIPGLSEEGKSFEVRTCVSAVELESASPAVIDAIASRILTNCKSQENTGDKWINCFTNELMNSSTAPAVSNHPAAEPDPGTYMNERNQFSTAKPLHKAAVDSDTVEARRLIDSGADVNAAADLGTFETKASCISAIGILLRGPRQGGAIPVRGQTPLHLAAACAGPDFAQLLLDNGANSNAGDEYGQTPLEYAAAAGNVRVAQILISDGALTSMADKGGFTPLYLAAELGNADMARLLIMTGGADANPQSADGRTPLFAAVEKNAPDIVRLLIDNGADLNARDDGGNTPLGIAVSGGFDAIAAMLRAQGAEEPEKRSDNSKK